MQKGLVYILFFDEIIVHIHCIFVIYALDINDNLAKVVYVNNNKFALYSTSLALRSKIEALQHCIPTMLRISMF